MIFISKSNIYIIVVEVRLHLPITPLDFYFSSNEQQTPNPDLFGIFIYLGRTQFTISVRSIMNNDCSHSIGGLANSNMIGRTLNLK